MRWGEIRTKHALMKYSRRNEKKNIAQGTHTHAHTHLNLAKWSRMEGKPSTLGSSWLGWNTAPLGSAGDVNPESCLSDTALSFLQFILVGITSSPRPVCVFHPLDQRGWHAGSGEIKKPDLSRSDGVSFFFLLRIHGVNRPGVTIENASRTMPVNGRDVGKESQETWGLGILPRPPLDFNSGQKFNNGELPAPFPFTSLSPSYFLCILFCPHLYTFDDIRKGTVFSVFTESHRKRCPETIVSISVNTEDPPMGFFAELMITRLKLKSVVSSESH